MSNDPSIGLLSGDRSQGYEVSGPADVDGLNAAYMGKDTRDRDAAVTLIWLDDDVDASHIFDSARLFDRLDTPALIGARTVVRFGSGSAVVVGKEAGAPLQGTTLNVWLERRGAISLQQAMGLFQPVLESIKTIHGQGFAHGSINALHGLVDGKDALRLMGPWQANGAEAEMLLAAAQAPERLGGDAPSPAADIYSLCSLLYWTLSGQKAPSAQERLSSTAQHDDDPFVPLDNRVPGLPQALSDIINQGLRLHPATRPQTIDDLLAVMGNLADDPMITPVPETSRSAPTPTDQIGQAPPPLPSQSTGAQNGARSRIPTIPHDRPKTSSIGQAPPPLPSSSGTRGTTTARKLRWPAILSFVIALGVAFVIASGGFGLDDSGDPSFTPQQERPNNRPDPTPEPRKGPASNRSEPTTQATESDGVLEQFCTSRFMFESNRDAGTSALRDYVQRCSRLDGPYVDDARRILGLSN